MNIIHINTFPHKAPGSIMMHLHYNLKNTGINSFVIWGRGRSPVDETEYSIEDKTGIMWHGIYSRIFDKTGFASKNATKELIKKLEEIKPDIIHLHNLHGYYLNIEILFNYMKANNIKIIWTLHDCWPFTGHCAYFDMVGCNKWLEGCYSCEQSKTYPSAFLSDNSRWNWYKKREIFSGLNITIVTPSEWLANLVRSSFLGQYPVYIIPNGIDTSIFKKRESKLKNKYNLRDKLVILGVASEWTERKGLKDFIKLKEMLDHRFKIVLVGLTKKQISSLPEGIVGIERTKDARELAEFYTMADIFFNPTYEDNFPTTNLESLACGTPVCTYKTGGSPEALSDNCGLVLKKGDYKGLLNLISDNPTRKFGFIFDEEETTREYTMEKMFHNYMTIAYG